MASFIYFADLNNPEVVLNPSGIQSCNVVTESSLMVDQLAYDELVVKANSEGAVSPFITSDNYFMSDEDGEIMWGIAAQASFADYPYGTPIWLYDDNTLLGKYYITSIRRTARLMYEITAVSPIGLMSNMSHHGGMYNGETFAQVLTDIIGTSTAGTYNERVIDDDVAATPIYGYLPAATQRKNLHQLLFATGVNCKRDEYGVMYFTFPDSDTAISVPDNEVYVGGSVSYSDPSTGVEITEHSYLANDTEETIFTNIGGEAAVSTTVTFSNPHHTLRGESLTIEESGPNYAIVSGTGTLYGKKYDHATATLSKSTEVSNVVDKITKITNCTLINYLNSETVAGRTAAYHSNAANISAEILQNGRFAGDIISFTDPFGERISGFISKMSTNITSIFKSRCQIITGYMPSGGGNTYNNVAVITESGTWSKPAGVTKIKMVLIGGGSRGTDGGNGESGSWNSSWPDRYTKNSIGGGSGGKGGAGGTGGNAGKIYQLSLNVDAASDSYTVTVGSGGNASNVEGGHSMLSIGSTEYSSENGASSATGFTDLLNGITYALNGKDGIDGSDGMNGADSGSSTYFTPTSVYNTYTGNTYYGGNGCLWARETIIAEIYDERKEDYVEKEYDVRVGGAGGGGASAYENGESATSGTVSYFSPNIATFYMSKAGKGASGGNAALPAAAGCGGNGGHGGGGGGGAGGYWVQKPHDYTELQILFDDLFNGGPGGIASNGADGIVLIYY